MRENALGQPEIGVGVASYWVRKWCEFFNQSQSGVKENQSTIAAVSKKTS